MSFSGHNATVFNHDGKPQLYFKSNNLCVLVSRLSENIEDATSAFIKCILKCTSKVSKNTNLTQPKA